MSKRMKHIAYVLLILAFCSCGEQKEQNSIDFLEPQPAGLENLRAFNKQFQGEYINAEDSACLIISRDKVIRERRFSLVFSRYDLDSTYAIDKSNNKQVEEVLLPQGIHVDRFDGDTVYATLSVMDTVFAVSANDLLRYYKGAYFLNSTEDNFTWKVQRLQLNKEQLSLGMIMPDDSLFAVMPVQQKSMVKDDSGAVLSYQIKPTKKELKGLIKDETFSVSDVWIKKK